MARKNPEIERLERVIRLQREQIDRMSKDPSPMPVEGCGDHSCLIKRPEGMGTNGGCRCDERKLRRALQWYKAYSIFLTETIATLRSSAEQERHFPKMDAAGSNPAEETEE